MLTKAFYVSSERPKRAKYSYITETHSSEEQNIVFKKNMEQGEAKNKKTKKLSKFDLSAEVSDD